MTNIIARTLLTACVLCSAAFAQTSTTNGITASLDIAVIEQAKDVYFDKVLKLIQSVQIPNYDSGDVYLHGNTFTLNQAATDVVFAVDHAKNAVTLTCNKLSAHFHTASFRAKKLFFVATGHADVDIHKVTIGVGLQFTTQTLTDGRVVPGVNAVDIKVDIDDDDIDIHISGNIWSDFASLFESLFKGTIADMIKDEVRDALQSGIPEYGNKFVARTDGKTAIPTFPHWYLDWMTAEAATVTDTSFGIGIRGILYDDEFGESMPSSYPSMPYKDTTTPAQFQFFTSEASVDSLFASWLQVGGIAAWVRDSDIPAGSPFNLTTTQLDAIIFSGMEAYYGADLPVDVFVNVTRLYDFTVKHAEETVSAHGDIDLQFWVNTSNGTKELAVDVTVQALAFEATVLVNGFNLTGNITKVRIGDIIQNSCTFGSISTDVVKVALNTAFRIATPLINVFLGKYSLPIPSDIFGIFQLSDLVLEYFDGYIYAGATPTFLPPALMDYGMNDLSHDAQDGHLHPAQDDRTVHYQGNEFMFIEQ